MDVTMPEMNGVDAIKAIIKDSPKAKIIVVSAITQKNIIITAVSSGALNYILKPYSPEKVVEAINKILGTNNALPIDTTDRFENTVKNINSSIERVKDSILNSDY